MSKLKNILAGVALATVVALSGQTAKAQSNVEYIQNAKQETSRIRPNLFYNLPGDVKAYTFIEFYNDGDNYFAKTTLNKSLGHGISARTEIKNSSFFKDYAKLGMTYSLPIDGVSSSLKFLPFNVNTSGEFSSPMTVGYSVSKKWGPVSLSSFGEYDIANKTWGYGETYVGYNVGQFEIAAGVDIRSDLENVIKLDPGVKLTFTPKVKAN